jgi:hypothetical protein
MIILFRIHTLMFFILSFSVIGGLFAQEPGKTGPAHEKQTGVEVQWYPAGWIVGPVVNYYITPKHILNFRAAVNMANRHDWSGLNDDEQGTGFGGSIGYRYLFTPERNSFYIGARVDLWNMKIDWENDPGTAQETSGSTRVLVLQPSAELGYRINFKKSKWILLLSGGIGQEINIKTNGKEVGQGGMWLLGISTYYTFK